MENESMMPGGAVRWMVDGHLGRIELCRIDKRNALRVADWRDFADALDAVARAGAKALVLCSRDPSVFSSGSDLSELRGLASDAEARLPFALAMDAVMRRLCEGPVVTIAAISGPCIGAGVAIAMACNMRVADQTASFAIPPARFGISYPAGDIDRLVQLVGPGHASRLLYGATSIDSVEALRIGLVEEMASSALDRAEALGRAVAANSSASLALLKRALASPRVAVEEDSQFTDGFGTDDFRRFVGG